MNQTEDANGELAFVAISCPESRLQDCLSFYSILGITKPPEDAPTATTSATWPTEGAVVLDALGYENVSDSFFQLILVQVPDFSLAQEDNDVEEDIDGTNKLVFYVHDIVATIETIESLSIESVHVIQYGMLLCLKI